MAFNERGQIVPNAGVTGWVITSQQETTELDQRGLAVHGVRIYFTTGKGQPGSVFIASNRYNAVNARAEVAARAAAMDEVAGLSG